MGVQLVIGRLLTDVEFRSRFEKHRKECLEELGGLGIRLEDFEKAVLIAADAAVWSKLATRLDPRFQIGSLRVDSPCQVARPLTVREQRVVRRVVEGLSNKQIAADLRTSETAVKATLQRVFQKVHVRTRARLVRAAIETLLRPKVLK